MAGLLFAGLCTLAVEMFRSAKQWEFEAIEKDFRRQAADALVITSGSLQEFSNGTRRPLPPPPTSLPSHTFFLLAGQQETAFSLFSSSAWSTSRSDFTALTNYSMATFPNVFGCFLVQKVNGSDRAAYEEFAINQGGARQSADSAL